PCRSVIVMIVLLKDAWMCAMPSATFLRTFLRTRVLALAMYDCLRFSLRCDGPHDLHRRLARTLTRASVRARTLSADREPGAVAFPPPRPEVHQPLDAHRDL